MHIYIHLPKHVPPFSSFYCHLDSPNSYMQTKCTHSELNRNLGLPGNNSDRKQNLRNCLTTRKTPGEVMHKNCPCSSQEQLQGKMVTQQTLKLQQVITLVSSSIASVLSNKFYKPICQSSRVVNSYILLPSLT